MPIPAGADGYTLNHYYKNVVRQNFGVYFQERLGALRPTHVWQLVPDVFSLEAAFENATEGVVMPMRFEIPKDYVWQEHGYWHIGRSQVMFRKYADREYYNNDMANQLKLNHMDMTFEPSWHCAPGEKKGADPRAVKAPSESMSMSMASSAPFPGGGPGASDMWAPALSLESIHSILHAPPPVHPAAPVPRVASEPDHRGLHALFSGGSRPAPRAAPIPAPVDMDMDIGRLEDAVPPPVEGFGAMLAQGVKRRKKVAPVSA